MHRLIVCLAMVVVLAGTANATTLVETPDVGQTLATAYLLPGGTTQVLGAVTGTDADLYEFFWGGGSFYVNSVGSSFDSQLFLFNSTGQGVQGNDDGIALAGPAYLQLPALAAGSYYLGISAYNLDPFSSAGQMFTSYDGISWSGLYGPLNPGGLSPLDHWAFINDGHGGQGNLSGNYVINFRQTTDTGEQGDENPTGAVPEPATLMLLGSGLAGMLLRRKRA